MFDDKHGTSVKRFCCVLLIGAVYGCSGGERQVVVGGHSEYEADGAGLTQHALPTFEEFRDRVRNDSVEYELYMVEGDIPLRSEAELRAYYDELVAGYEQKSTAHPNGSGTADRWTANEQLGMKYCVSDAFGAGKQLMIDGMRGAVLAWQQLGNMWYRYDPTQDAHCAQGDPLPAGYGFKVSPWTTGNACSFFPYEQAGGCVPSSLVYTDTAADGIAPDDSLGNVIKVLTHELGHTLGFAHENSRDDYATGTCVDSTVVDLTAFDSQSIMEGGAASCAKPSDPGVPSLLDGQGLRILYGSPASHILVATGGGTTVW